MPHDQNGKEIKVGDYVNVPCLVTQVQVHPDYCNIALETKFVMFPGNAKSQLSLNATQVEKAD